MLASLLAACGPSKPASVLGGECRLVATPSTVILGKTPRDQDWIDDTTEALVAGCGQPRPGPRRRRQGSARGRPHAYGRRQDGAGPTAAEKSQPLEAVGAAGARPMKRSRCTDPAADALIWIVIGLALAVLLAALGFYRV
jgi:hypothetical protein